MEQVEQGFSLKDFVRTTIRRRQLLLWVAGSIIVVAMLFASLLPAKFRSTAVVLIEKQEIPTDLVRSTVSSYADQRIQVISQRVMTIENLSNIVQKYDLYAKDRRHDPMEVVLEQIRKDINRQMISADVIDPTVGRAVATTIAFRLSFVNESPAVAQKVANELVSLYLNENLKSRTQTAQQTTTFLAQEDENLKKHIDELEVRLADFKEKNTNQLPENAAMQRDLLERARSDLAETQRQRSEANQRKVMLQAQIAGVSPYAETISDTGRRVLNKQDRVRVLQDQLTSAKASYGPNHPDVRRLQRELNGVQAGSSTGGEPKALVEAKADFDALSKQYGANHPDVQAAQRKVDTLKASAQSAPAPELVKPDNPAYLQIESQIVVTDAELQSLDAKSLQVSQRTRELEGNIQNAPKAEMEYREITRDYETSMVQYKELTAKRRSADLSKSLEDERQSEKFTLIEPANLPEEPFSPNRFLLMGLGVIGALVGGFGAVGLTEALDTRIHGRAAVMAFMGAPPLALIPLMTRPQEKKSRSRNRWLAVAILLALFVAAVVVFHFWFIKLDVLWYMVLRKLGLGEAG